ncbi:hypothetical protein EII25_05080 [Erysipelotrichaceae bacterium OH741_COT-311]|nr:hypothetical protein EII25_05080 [Erysipelotrichaceae bacterium OH741_COT-311]
MSQTKKSKPKMRRSKVRIFIFVGILIILIPFIILGVILIQASMSTGKPILGDRFKNDLNPAITSEQLKEISTKIKGQSNVDSVDVSLKTATLRVYVDVSDASSEQQVMDMSKSAYQDVISILDVNTYFTQHDGKEMYDIEIHAYNQDKNTEENFIYVITNKNSSMEKEHSQVVSKALDPELAQQLRDDVLERENKKKQKATEPTDLEVQGQETEESTTTNP